MGQPLLSKMTLKGSPPPPRLSMNIGSGSGLLLVAITIQGKSLGTETPLDMIPATPFEAVKVCIFSSPEALGAGGATVVEASANGGAVSGQCPPIMN